MLVIVLRYRLFTVYCVQAETDNIVQEKPGMFFCIVPDFQNLNRNLLFLSEVLRASFDLQISALDFRRLCMKKQRYLLFNLCFCLFNY